MNALRFDEIEECVRSERGGMAHLRPTEVCEPSSRNSRTVAGSKSDIFGRMQACFLNLLSRMVVQLESESRNRLPTLAECLKRSQSFPPSPRVVAARCCLFRCLLNVARAQTRDRPWICTASTSSSSAKERRIPSISGSTSSNTRISPALTSRIYSKPSPPPPRNHPPIVNERARSR